MWIPPILGGATGPTFRPEGLETGFAVLAVAGRRSKGGETEVLAQKVVRSTHANRELNMRLFADSAAELCLEAVASLNPDISTVGTAGIVGTAGKKEEGICLDRSSHLRNDADAMAELNARPDALHIMVRGTDEIMFESTTTLGLPTLADIIKDGTIAEEVLKKRTFVGRLGVAPVFALFLPKDADYSYQDCFFANTRPRAPLLTPLHTELALSATAYGNWQNTHNFCHVCGSRLEYVHGGTVRRVVTNENTVLFFFIQSDQRLTFYYSVQSVRIAPANHIFIGLGTLVI